MKATSHAAEATASVASPEFGKSLSSSGSVSRSAKKRSRSTVTPRGPLLSCTAKKVVGAGAATTAPRKMPVGASC
jgi:hypothetical protein